MAFTYILYSPKLDRYYIGHTDHSLEERLQKHFSDHTGFTSKAKDWSVVFSKFFDSKADAFEFERQIKKWKSRRAIENLIKES